MISGQTTELQRIDVNERIVSLERLNPTARPTTYVYSLREYATVVKNQFYIICDVWNGSTNLFITLRGGWLWAAYQSLAHMH